MKKLIWFDLRVLVLSLVFAAANALMYGQFESVLFSILLGIFSFIVVWAFWLVINCLVVLTSRMPLIEDEQKQLLELSSVLADADSKNRNGILVLTDRKIYFKPHLLSRERQLLTIDLGDIKAVSLRNLGFFDRFNMSVRTESECSYLFRVYAGQRWADELRALNICVVPES